VDRFAGTTAADSVNRAIAAGRESFGTDWWPDAVAIAPGRIELLGNHVDYNGGPVLAAAIDRFVAVAIRREPDTRSDIRVVAADLPESPVVTIWLDNHADWRNPSPPPNTFDYVRGMIAALYARSGSGDAGQRPGDATLAIAGDVPIGFGVSSSAALCVALGLAFTGENLSRHDLVLLAQEAEHRAGTPCGTMDQSASVAGGVIAFDGATLAMEELSPDLGDLVFAVVDSGVERSLGASSYPVRVAESQEALRIANASLGVNAPHLAELRPDQVTSLRDRNVLPSPLGIRAQHVVDEVARVREGRAAMESGNWERFGALMTASGRSSATLYEISHPLVEELVAESLQAQGVLGARMMGGGEGGVALVLLAREAVPDLNTALEHGYFQRHPLTSASPRLHICAFAPGATVIAGNAIHAYSR
jgi:galactokinase